MMHLPYWCCNFCFIQTNSILMFHFLVSFTIPLQILLGFPCLYKGVHQREQWPLVLPPNLWAPARHYSQAPVQLYLIRVQSFSCYTVPGCHKIFWWICIQEEWHLMATQLLQHAQLRFWGEIAGKLLKHILKVGWELWSFPPLSK